MAKELTAMIGIADAACGSAWLCRAFTGRHLRHTGGETLPILTRIRSNGQHLLGLINTVLDISKIEAGQFKLNIGEYALGSVVETVMVATESLAATKKLAFKMDIALPYGLGDEQRLTQVLLNLVGNAIKFTDAGEVRIAAGAGNGHFTVSVSDTGPGIPPEECEHIFEKFRQVDSSNTRAVARGSVSPLPERSSKCTAGASGLSRGWVKARRFAWSCPCAPQPVQHEQTHSYRGGPGGSARHPARFPIRFRIHRDRGRGWR
jgi:signal transduction histidine kinase